MFKTAYHILRNNMIFIQPLLLYMLLVMSAAIFISGRTIPNATRINLLVCFVLLTIAFLTGWFHVNKLGVKKYNLDDTQEVITQKTIESIKQFFTGIGEKFLKILFGSILFVAIYAGISFCVTKLCLMVLGNPTIIMDFQNIAKMQTKEEITAYLSSVSLQDQINFVNWFFAAIVTSSVLNYFGILYFSVMSFEDKNAIVSLWKSILFFFKNIFSNIAIILVMFFLYFLLNLLSLLLGTNSFSFAILIIMFTLYLNYYVLLVMWFYNEQTKNNSDNRSE